MVRASCATQWINDNGPSQEGSGAAVMDTRAVRSKNEGVAL